MKQLQPPEDFEKYLAVKKIEIEQHGIIRWSDYLELLLLNAWLSGTNNALKKTLEQFDKS